MTEHGPNYLDDVRARLKGLFHKEGVSKDDWEKVHPNLLILADCVLSHCETHNLPLVISSIIRPKIKGVSKTDIHADGRAFDVSVRGWSRSDIDFIVQDVNERLSLGAISVRDGQEREAVYEDGVVAGKGAHLHFQVRR